jgi:Flp pilus assembly protein TadG
LAAFAADRSGNVAVITALSLPVLLGGTGLGVEVSYWYVTQRSMQNAADSAVIAAATVGGSTYDAEAKAVAAKYGFQHGVKNISIVTSNNATCPAGSTSTSTNCYSVKITGYVPLFLSQLVGYNGTNDVTVTAGGNSTTTRQTAISTTSVALPEASPRNYCIVTLGEGGVSFTSNGAPQANLDGCGLMSNGSATCNGHNLGADYGDAVGTNNGCGEVTRSNVPRLNDPYVARWTEATSQQKTNPCSTYYRKPVQTNGNNPDPPLPASNQWAVGGTRVLSNAPATHICGDLQLTGASAGTLEIETPSEGGVLVIWNGNLEFGPHTLKTKSGSALTIIFAGSIPGVPNGTGKLDIVAPTSELSAWKGVAIYQVATGGTSATVEIGAAGNDPAWSITGLVYLPNSSITFSGVVNKASYGASCFVLVVNDMRINGTGAILNHGQCHEAGLDMPTGSGTVRGRLVS